MSDPLVSILVPTYNGERFLRPALRSALEQSYREIEVLVGDDASTDRTAAILAEFAAGDPRVRVIRHDTNLGGFGNPRRLLELARGEYVKFLLHDDVLASNCVRELVRGMQSTPGATMAFSRRVLIGDDGRPLPGGQFEPLVDRPGRIDGRELGDAVLENCNNVIGELTTVLFRREDVDPADLWQVDGRRLTVLGDLALWLRLLARGSAFYTPSTLSRFRLHSTQSSQDPRILARGLGDWPRLIDWGVRAGFLGDPQKQRRANVTALAMAVARAGELGGGPEARAMLEAAFLATARLVELNLPPTEGDPRPLTERAHTAPLLDRFRQELDVWAAPFPVALARLAAPEPGEVRAVLDGFREVRSAGAAERFLLAVTPPELEAAAPLVEVALADGADVDVELVPTDEPAGLVREAWLAVAERGATWHGGRADAVWTLRSACTDRAGTSSVTPR
ncbi:glycosyltransferase family 2 protein [Blastococcus sp. MG754426]|uniref:glycosyltransferase family 2 protein n=1 Tax=unclassified Blastococcus TaxID=2619396 RepID=UPI001EF0F1EB|nr:MULTISPECIES: glycosyltransferase family 2 protein [unclassified Blastococcus]MCF6509194.1 glycosyltransferase family 2 protein [Blastococcus sp. MG754426]MCF6513762.1 glycosyltransferase family 2 protein [Blastococcus sp. MG754427]MCF6736326.1 glycosyltransferase family 2 protein [Blastococcus sp. KM273129]